MAIHIWRSRETAFLSAHNTERRGRQQFLKQIVLHAQIMGSNLKLGNKYWNFPDPIGILVKSWWYWKIGEDCSSSKLEKISTCQTPKYVVVLVDSCSVMYWARYGNSCTELGIDKYSRLLDMRLFVDCFFDCSQEWW